MYNNCENNKNMKNKFKGIVLAGGHGSRLYPMTDSISKHLLPIYDKPMIYYSLSVLMIANIREILIISNSSNIENFRLLLGDGSKFGISLSYEVQKEPDGIASAFILGEKFIDKDNICLILGDNIFYGQDFKNKLNIAMSNLKGANVFAYQVLSPNDYGIIEFDKNFNPIKIVEKPKNSKSNYALTGLYFYDNSVIEKAYSLKKSRRGEYEISDINKFYLKNNDLNVQIFGRGFAWLDAGTAENLLSAARFVETIEKRQGLKIACLEEIAYRNNWISKDDVISLCKHNKNDYTDYLLKVVNSED